MTYDLIKWPRWTIDFFKHVTIERKGKTTLVFGHKKEGRSENSDWTERVFWKIELKACDKLSHAF